MSDFIDESRTMTPARREHIHNHRKKADVYGPELPYSIGKAAKSRPRNRCVTCDCGNGLFVSETTYIVICSHCGKLVKTPRCGGE
jgi:hypothetical protein